MLFSSNTAPGDRSTMCLDVTGFRNVVGTRMQVRRCHGKWTSSSDCARSPPQTSRTLKAGWASRSLAAGPRRVISDEPSLGSAALVGRPGAFVATHQRRASGGGGEGDQRVVGGASIDGERGQPVG